MSVTVFFIGNWRDIIIAQPGRSTRALNQGAQPKHGMDTTQHDLKILSICYYIMAGITGAYVLIIGAYVSLVGAMLTKLPMTGTRGQTIPDFVPSLIAGIGAAMVGLGLLTTAILFGAAWSLPKRRNYPLVMTAAVLNCLQVPFGTALGVFTFVVLNRQGVKESFYMAFRPVPATAPPPPLPPPGW
jgi:hypothetical protein